MKRILLFLGTNIAVLVVLSVVMQLLGIESMLNEQGTQLDLQALLIFSAVIGFSGSFISLAISKWSAKRLTGARVIETPRNAAESWLLNTVQRQAQLAGISMPEVAVYDSPEVNAFATGARRNNALVAVSTKDSRTVFIAFRYWTLTPARSAVIPSEMVFPYDK